MHLPARPTSVATPLTGRSAERATVRLALESAVLRLFVPVDIASIVTFRIAFGAIMLVEMFGYLNSYLIATDFIEPTVHFPFVGFEWIRPWPGIGMYVHFWVLAAAALGILLGCFYRLSAAVFCLGFTYVFLMEKTYYLNHFYLICLLSFLLIFIPAGNACSVDASRRPSIRAESAPAWAIWLLRGQLAIVYVFGGIAKLNGDWLRGEPMRMWLAAEQDFPLIGRWFDTEWMVNLFTYGGLLLDLFVVPLLLWRPTRLAAVVLLVTFHLINAGLFQIGIFPWFMIAATVLFFPPDLPRSLLPSRHAGSAQAPQPIEFGPSVDSGPLRHVSPCRFLLAGAVAVYFAVQIAVPLRHLAYPGNVNWTEEGHRFSWHMKLRSKTGEIRFFVTYPTTGTTEEIDPHHYLTPLQVSKMAFHPDMILQFSHYLATEVASSDNGHVEVRVCALAALNDRPTQMLIDPTVDLAAVSYSLAPADWIIPLGNDVGPDCALP